MKNKPRHRLKKDGSVKAWVCKHCGAPYCNPMYLNPKTYAGRKILRRLSNKECIGCGKKECSCKNTNRPNWRVK